jgi:hypothetical protein
MNSYVQQHFDVFRQTMALREQMLDLLMDDDLRYRLPGANPTLGELCRESGETEYAYIQSFKTLRHDFTYRNNNPELAQSVAALKDWLSALDADILATIEGLSEEELGRMIDRGGWSVPGGLQAHIYREAVLIFCAKASVYLKAMERTLPTQWLQWIG